MKTVFAPAAFAAAAVTLVGVRILSARSAPAAAPDVAHAAPREDTSPSVAAVSPALGCADTVLCVGDCARSDAACVAECERAIASGAAQYRALMRCAEAHACDGDALCARKSCGAELNACLCLDATEGCSR